MLDVPIFHMAKYVLIKLVRDDKAAKPAAPISITHFRTIGCTHERFKLYPELMTTVRLLTCYCVFRLAIEKTVDYTVRHIQKRSGIYTPYLKLVSLSFSFL